MACICRVQNNPKLSHSINVTHISWAMDSQRNIVSECFLCFIQEKPFYDCTLPLRSSQSSLSEIKVGASLIDCMETWLYDKLLSDCFLLGCHSAAASPCCSIFSDCTVIRCYYLYLPCCLPCGWWYASNIQCPCQLCSSCIFTSIHHRTTRRKSTGMVCNGPCYRILMKFLRNLQREIRLLEKCMKYCNWQ